MGHGKGQPSERFVRDDLRSLKSFGDEFARFHEQSLNLTRHEKTKDNQTLSTKSVNPKQEMVDQIKNVFNSNQVNNENDQPINGEYDAEHLMSRINTLEQRSSKIQDFCALQLSVFKLTLNTLSTSFNKNFETNLDVDKTNQFHLDGNFSIAQESTESVLPPTPPMQEEEEEKEDSGEKESAIDNRNNDHQRVIKTERNTIDEFLEDMLATAGGKDNVSNISEALPESETDIAENETRAVDVYPNTKDIDKMQCLECQYKAPSIQSLKLHIKYKHENSKEHPCSKCDYTCKRKDNLNTHMKLKHKLDIVNRQRGRPVRLKPVAALTYEKPGNAKDTKVLQGRDNIQAQPSSSHSSSSTTTQNQSADTAIENFFDNLTQVLGQESSKGKLKLEEVVKQKIKAENNKKLNLGKEQSKVKNMSTEKSKKEDQPTDHQKPQSSVATGGTQCPMCSYAPTGKTASQTNAILKLHVKAVHEKVKDKVCSFCDYRTAQKSNLNTHVKSKHGDKVLKEGDDKRRRGGVSRSSKSVAALTFENTDMEEDCD